MFRCIFKNQKNVDSRGRIAFFPANKHGSCANASIVLAPSFTLRTYNILLNPNFKVIGFDTEASDTPRSMRQKIYALR